MTVTVVIGIDVQGKEDRGEAGAEKQGRGWQVSRVEVVEKEDNLIQGGEGEECG